MVGTPGTSSRVMHTRPGTCRASHWTCRGPYSFPLLSTRTRVTKSRLQVHARPERDEAVPTGVDDFQTLQPVGHGAELRRKLADADAVAQPSRESTGPETFAGGGVLHVRAVHG